MIIWQLEYWGERGNCNTFLSKRGTTDNERHEQRRFPALASKRVARSPFAVNANEGSALCYFRFPAETAMVSPVSWIVIAPWPRIGMTRKSYLNGRNGNAQVSETSELCMCRIDTELCDTRDSNSPSPPLKFAPAILSEISIPPSIYLYERILSSGFLDLDIMREI